eukprot:TRINITY_DN63555_c0_g1_i1.p1 TRINITY_DN63555_c0_g1~~TRINITY_DN63555_c0_g1_i1.p1  ORF type:complete len:967 (+),score=173.51 TRINITY_DN63555_c0_g1_i1:69-2969(+)
MLRVLRHSRYNPKSWGRASKGGPARIDYEHFSQWTDICRVRKVQAFYDELVEDAQVSGRTLQAELQRRGYRDPRDFVRQCDQFNLTCWPSELGELGSGFVLYFDLLKVLGVMLLCYGLVGIGFQVHPQKDSNWLLVLYLVFVLSIFSMVVVMARHSTQVEAAVRRQVLLPSDFAVLVRGLPETATDERTIKDFFIANAVADQETEVVKVVIGWKTADYRANMKQLNDMKKRLRKLDPNSEEHQELLNETVFMQQGLETATKASVNGGIRSSGTVVVVFRFQADLEACLQRWGGTWARWFYRDARTCCCWGTRLPYFPCADNASADNASAEKSQPHTSSGRLRIERAPNPGDINWEDLGGNPNRCLRLIKSTTMLLLTLSLCFGAIYGLAQLQLHFKQEGIRKAGSNDEVKFKVLAPLPGVLVAVVNAILGMQCRKYAKEEYHETFTQEEFSAAWKMSLCMFFNTGGNILLSNLSSAEWYVSGGLLEKVFFILLMDATVTRFMFMNDSQYAKNAWFRRKVTQEKLDSWSSEIASALAEAGGNNGDPALVKQHAAATARLLDVQSEVEEYKGYFEPSTIDNPERYARMLTTFFCSILYVPLFPVAPLLGFVGLSLQYGVDKFLLLRWYKRPHYQNATLPLGTLKAIGHVAPQLVGLSSLFFLMPLWRDQQKILTHFALVAASSLVFSLLPLSWWISLFCSCCCSRTVRKSTRDFLHDYYEAQHLWSRSQKYHTDHFIYKELPISKNPELLKRGVDADNTVEDIQQIFALSVERATRRFRKADTSATCEALDSVSSPEPSPHFGSSESVSGRAPSVVSSRSSKNPFSNSSTCLGEGDGEQPDDGAAAADSLASPPASTAAAMPPDERESNVVSGNCRSTSGEALASHAEEEIIYTGPEWQFETSDGWLSFHRDAITPLEEAYTAYTGGTAASSVVVDAGLWKVQVDFERMEQTLLAKGKVKKVRRIEKE